MTPPSVNPLTMQGEIVIATRDYETAIILPLLIQLMSKEAPGLKLRVIPLVGDDLTPLDRNEVDMVLAASESESATFGRYALFQDDFVCMVSANNPVTQEDLTLDKFVKMNHCMVTISGFGLGHVDMVLAENGLKRNVVVRIPHFHSASYMVSGSDLIITLPRRMALILACNESIKLLEPPILLGDFSVYLYWHIRNQHNPVHKWVRNVVRHITSVSH